MFNTVHHHTSAGTQPYLLHTCMMVWSKHSPVMQMCIHRTIKLRLQLPIKLKNYGWGYVQLLVNRKCSIQTRLTIASVYSLWTWTLFELLAFKRVWIHHGLLKLDFLTSVLRLQLYSSIKLCSISQSLGSAHDVYRIIHSSWMLNLHCWYEEFETVMMSTYHLLSNYCWICY